MENNIIRRVAGSVLYLKSALGLNDEILRKIGSSEHVSSRKKVYRSSGNLSSWIHTLVGDKVDEFAVQGYLQDYKYEDLDTKGKISDYFNVSEVLDNTFKNLKLDKMYKDIFDDIKHRKNIWGDIIFSDKHYGFVENIIGLYSKSTTGYCLGNWLYGEPRTKKSVGFWRSLVYTFKDFDSILEADIYKTCNKNSTVEYLFYCLHIKLENLAKVIKENCSNPEDIDTVKKLYLSYCTTMDNSIRDEIEDEIFDIINKYKMRS